MKKRWISIFLIAALLCTMDSTPAFADSAAGVQDVTEEAGKTEPVTAQEEADKEVQSASEENEVSGKHEEKKEKEAPMAFAEESDSSKESVNTDVTTKNAEIRAVFDKASYEAGETVSVTITITGTAFDMAGFHLSYQPEEMEEVSLIMGDHFYNAARSSQKAGKIEVLATAAGIQDVLEGTILATIRFKALKAGSPSLEFSAGSQLYLDGKSAIAFKEDTEIPVTARVIKDAQAETNLQKDKETAKQELRAYAEALFDQAGESKKKKLQESLQDGLEKIERTEDAQSVTAALDAAKQQLDEIMKMDFTVSRLEQLSDQANLSKTAEQLSPSFSPEQTTYYLQNNRPVNGVPRVLYAKTEAGTTVTFNGENVRVSNDGTFSFSVPFLANQNRNVLVLKNAKSGLCTEYMFYSFGTGVSTGVKSCELLDAEGKDAGEQNGKWKAAGAVREISTYLSQVKLQVKVGIRANSVFRAELLDQNETVVKTFYEAAGEDEKTVDLTSDILSLQKGMNTWFLRCYGSYREYEDGKPVEKQGQYTYVFLIHCQGEVADPSLTDAELSDLSICLEEGGGKNYFEGLKIGQYEYEMTLPAEDFTSVSTKQSVWAFPKEKAGQELTVSAHNDKTWSPDCRRKESGYYEIFDYDVTEFGKKDTIILQITVTAKDKIHQKVYTVRIHKTGKAGMSIPEAYKSREYIITPTQPDRKINMVMESIVLTDEEGKKLSTASCMKKKMLTIEIGDESILKLDEEQPVDGSNYVIRMQKCGKTPVYVTFQYNGQSIKDTIYVEANYSAEMIKTEVQDAEKLLYEAKYGERIYAAGAEEALREVKARVQLVYEKYKAMNRYYMAEEQRQEINQAVLDMIAANENFRRSEIGKKITAFDELDRNVQIQQVENEAKLSDLKLPEELGATIDGKHVRISGVKWSCRPEWKEKTDQSYRYYFTPTFPVGYVVMEGVSLPSIRVDRGEKKFIFPVTSSLPLAVDVAIQRVPLGTEKSALKLPNLQTYVRPDLAQGLMDIPTVWVDQDGYDGNRVGTYVFQSMLDPSAKEFKVGENAKKNTFRTITVIVYQPEHTGDETKPGESTGSGGKGETGGAGSGSQGGNEAAENNGTNGSYTGGSGSSVEQQETEAALTEEKKQTQNSNNAPGGRTETDAVQSGNGSTGQGSIGKVYSVIAATMKENPLFTVFAVLILLLLLLAGMLWGWKKRKE